MGTTEDIRDTRSVELVLMDGALYDATDGSRPLPAREEYRPMYFQRGD